jgi:hypothetical protein
MRAGLMDNWSEAKKECYYDFLDQMIKDGYIVKKVKRVSKQKADIIPYEKVVNIYNKWASDTNNPQVTAITETRKRVIKKAWLLDTNNDNVKLRSNNLEYFERLFKYAEGNEFLNGNTQRGEGHSNWRPNFEFMLREDTHLKLREGNY